jgi:hypothetical protein
VTREAQVRAYNDVISFNGVVAMLLLLWGTFLIARNQYQLRQQPKIDTTTHANAERMPTAATEGRDADESDEK